MRYVWSEFASQQLELSSKRSFAEHVSELIVKPVVVAACGRPITLALEHPSRLCDPFEHAATGGGQPGSPHVCVACRQTRPPVQCVSFVHSTQLDVAPLARQCGVGAAQGPHDAPHEVSVSHSTQAPDVHRL
jgi:hypothetical protein